MAEPVEDLVAHRVLVDGVAADDDHPDDLVAVVAELDDDVLGGPDVVERLRAGLVDHSDDRGAGHDPVRAHRLPRFGMTRLPFPSRRCTSSSAPAFHASTSAT